MFVAPNLAQQMNSQDHQDGIVSRQLRINGVNLRSTFRTDVDGQAHVAACFAHLGTYMLLFKSRDVGFYNRKSDGSKIRLITAEYLDW